MEKEQPIEKVYNLMETFDFNELPEFDKAFVLEHISIEEYNELRATIANTRVMLSKYPFKKAKEKQGMLGKLLTYPVELYKIAAIFLLFMGMGFMFFKVGVPKQSRLMASADTVYVEKINTVVLETRDTIRIIMERAVYRDHKIPENQLSYTTAITENTNYSHDCSIAICPADMGKLGAIKTRGDFSHDTALKGFITSIY